MSSAAIALTPVKAPHQTLPVEIRGPAVAGSEEVLTEEAVAFLADLTRTFAARATALLDRRVEQQRRRDRGELPRFNPLTEAVRDGSWKVAPLPQALLKRRVEITGPVSAKMVINALNSGADVFMADFEDATCPTWENIIDGQRNLMEAVQGTLTYEDAKRGKSYALNDDRALLMVRPRGWHLPESHLLVDGQPAPGGLVDFGLFFFHNARRLLEQGVGPYFYLPKLEGHLEARLWNDVFVYAQHRLGIPQGSIRATVLIETLPGAFEMDEILYELRDHAAGLNCGRWDYIFSFIKVRRADKSAVIPDRGQVGMTQPFMKAYSEHVIKTCHRRGALAMGGMAAQIPIKADPAANEAALAKVRADKEREAQAGHDGTWVAHPGLVPVAMEIFKTHLGDRTHQLDVHRDDVNVTADDLLAVPKGTLSEAGLRTNARVALQYLAAWLDGQGCVPLNHLMEDAATAEISRAQLWQVLHHEAALDDRTLVTRDRLHALIDEEVAALSPPPARLKAAADLLRELVFAPTCPSFLTLPAYRHIVKDGR